MYGLLKWCPIVTDRRLNFFLSPHAHLWRHIYDWNIVSCDVKHQLTTKQQLQLWPYTILRPLIPHFVFQILVRCSESQ